MTDAFDSVATGEAPPEKPRRNWARYWRIRITAGVALMFVALAVFFAVIDSPIGHRFIADSLSRYAPASGLRIEVGRIEGSVLDEAILRDVRFSDPEGVFARVPEVELAWKPFAWFTSGLDVRRLVFRRGELMRMPALNPGDPDAPILPNFDIRIDRLEFDALTVGPQIAGEARRVNLLGRARIADGRAKIAIDSALGGADRLAARLDMAPADNRFDLEIDYRAPAGGVLAGMVGAREDLRAVVTGDGDWRRWDGRLLVRRGGDTFAAFRLSNRAGRYGALGRIYPGDLLTGLAARAVGEGVSLRAEGTLRNRVVDGAARFKGRGLAGDVRGTVDLAENRFDDVIARLRLRDPALLGGDLRLRGMTARLVFDGAFRGSAVGYEAAADRVTLGALRLSRVRARGTGMLEDGRLTVPVRLMAGAIATGVAPLDRQLRGAVLTGTLVHSDGQLTADALRLAGPGIDARLALRGDLRRGLYALSGPVAAAGVPLANLGTVNMRGDIAATLGGPRKWTLNAALDGRMARITNAALRNIAGPPIAFSGRVELAAGAPILIRTARIDARDVDLSLTGRRALDGTVTVSGTGRHVRFGAFEIESSIVGNGPSAVLVFADPYPAAGLRDVRVAVNPSEDGFRIETEGQSLLGRFDGVLDLLAMRGGGTAIGVQRLSISDTDVTGQLRLLPGGVAGELALSGGGVSGTVGLSPDAAGQGIDAALRLRNARFAGAVPIQVRTANIRIDGTLGDDATLDAAINAQGISRADIFIGRLAAEGRLRDGAGDFRARIAGRRGSRFALRVAGDVSRERIAVGARGRYAGRDISMPRRAVLLRRDGASGTQWELQRSQIDFAGGRLQVEGQLGEVNAITLKLADMPMSVGDLLISDLGLGGTASGVVTYRDMPGEAPTGRARLLFDDLTRSGLVLTSRPVDLAVVAELSAGRFETRAVIRENGNRSGRLQARIDDLPASGAVIDRLRAGRLTGQARYRGPADAIWRLVAVELFDLTGEVRIAANMRGTFDDPQLRGTIRSDDLRMQSALTGTDIDGLALRGNFDGSVLRIGRFSGRAGNGGTVAGSGTIDLSDITERGVGMDIRIAAQQAQLLRRDEIGAVVTGPMRIVARDNRGTIAGRLRVESGRWQLGRASAAQSLPSVATREINLPADQQAARSRMGPWRYLIDVRADDRFTVTGLGLDSEWEADVRIRGTTAAPRLYGEAELVRGGYQFSGQRFELERGRIQFTGENPPDPQLNVLAVADVEDIDARIAISGSALAPQIAFSSVPALPEEEVLSRLLFGDSIANISAAEALQLGSAVAALQGGGSGLDPINRLRSAIGLDRLRIVGADEALGRGTSVAAGEYLGRNLYVELITDGRGYSASALEYRVTGWLSLLASVSSIGYNSVGAEVSRDY
ncbi:translocation/assembly module TamB domain-containing protein [uncultured Croceicoccus sp.]|uniref:translocation/assembly module TamB domain-containing protein n=1 Tax=uncultured Croceicoccus sp. TaxID=1295329 RepID=UPI0026156293|nr:translocation/assembly module TamB domain-containing protein [uncultured Croceicoccus sp.]